MDRLRRLPPTLWHFITITLFGFVLTTPLWMVTAVPCTHDGHLHYYRVAAMRHAWVNGLPFTRWLPDLAFGYGYPFFIYRESGPLYLPLGLHLTGIPLPMAENLVYALWLMAAGWFMYLWVRDIFGAKAGIVSAVAYMASPYLLIDTLVRGNSPESLALALLPLILWASRRWLLAKRPFALQFLIPVFSIAFLSLSHNISTLVFAPTLLVYLGALSWVHKLSWKTTIIRITSIIILGFGMTIFYTGGALLELDQVTLEQSTTTRNNDFHYNFASLSEMFAPVAPENPNLVNPPLLFRVGWMPALLATLGVTSILWHSISPRRKVPWHLSSVRKSAPSREQTAHAILMAIAAVLYLLLALPASLPFWENVPLVEFMQFPWRFVGRAALPIAFLAGVPFSRIWKSWRHFALLAALTLLVFEALPNLYPSICVEDGFPTITDVHDYETETGLVGVDPEGSYFPRTVRQRPSTSPLLADYAANVTPQRFDFPTEVTVNAVEYGNNRAVANLSVPQPFTALYYAFDFPGWTVRVDGEPVAIVPSDPDGLITFPVPAGEHTAEVRWRSTPTRSALTAVSVAALLVVLVGAVFLAQQPSLAIQGKEWPSSAALLHPYLLLALLALTLLAFKLLAVDRMETIFRRPIAARVEYAGGLLANEMRFEGFNLSQTAVSSNGTVDIDLAWTAVAPPSARYQSNVWLQGADGLIWSDKETQRPRKHEDAPPTWAWQVRQWGWDSREIVPLSGAPPGIYDLVLTLFDLDTLQPLTLLDEATGEVVGPTAVIGQLELTLPAVPPDFAPQYPLQEPMGGLALLGYNQDRVAAAPGDPLLLTLFWESGGGGSADFALELWDENGESRLTRQIVPAALEVLSGARLRQQELLRLPANLESGIYRIALNDLPLGELTINAPDRLFEEPAVETAVNIQFFEAGGRPFAELVGFGTAPPVDSTLPLTLTWKVVGETAVSYRVFVHLLDGDGSLVAQSDGEPANWTRSTTGWMAGEFVSDTHTLNGVGETILIGLYDPETGERLVLAGGETAVEIMNNE